MRQGVREKEGKGNNTWEGGRGMNEIQIDGRGRLRQGSKEGGRKTGMRGRE